MENLSHAVTCKKFSNRSNVSSNGFVAGKTVYDDVFGGPPKFGGVRTFAPRVEDYNEIFGGFHASRSSSTIPVLDLPIVDDERLVCFVDVKSSKFNYSEVFGGFDFHFSCDELFDHAKTGDFQEKEAWFRDPAENESLSAKSAPSTYSGKSQSLSNEDQSFEDINQGVNSHREAKQRNTDGTRNGTHCAESPFIPGFTFTIDKFTPSHIMEDKNALSQVNGGININSDFIEMDLGVKQFRKTMSHPPNNIVGIQTIGKGIIKPVRNYSQNGSHHNKPFLTVSEINLRTDPSELSPPLRPPPISKVDSSEALGDSSPPYFDVEVDASSATASAAAMKQAMEQAQAKLRSAKELMERKKEGLQNRSKTGFKEKNVKITKLVDGSNRLKDERVQAHEENSRMEVPYFVEGDEFFDVVEKSSVQRNAKESWSSQEFYRTDAAGEWKEPNALFELVKTDKEKKTEFMGQPRKEKKTASEACEFVDNRKEVLGKSQRKEDDILKLNIAVEIITQKDERNKLEVTHQKETEKSMASAGSGCDAWVIKSQSEEKYMEFEETMCQENKHKLNASNDRMLNGKRLHGTLKQGGDKKQFREGFQNVESEENTKQNLEKDELEKRVREVQQQEELEKSVKEAQQRVEHERRVLEALEHREKEKKLKVDLELKENEKRQAEAREREDIENKIKKGFERKENEKKLKEAFEKEVNERKQKESHDREEYEKGQREREVQQVEKRLREACKREKNENGLEEGHKIPEREKTAAELTNSSHDTAEGIELKGIQDAHESTVPYCFEKRNFNTDQGTCVQTKIDTINTSDEACKLDDNITRADKDVVNNEVKTVNVEATIEISAEELGEKINTEPKIGERVIEKKNGPCDGRFEAYGTVHDDLQDKEIQRNKEEELRPVPRDQEQSADILGETAIFSSQTGFEENIEKTQMSFDREKMDDNLDDEFTKKGKSNVQEKVAFNRVPNKSEFSLTQMRNKGNENNNKTGTAASCTSEGKSNTKISAEEVKTRQSSKTIEKNVSGHVTLEEDHLQKLNEEREREREREKDRMAVERATCEVRERSYAESRERAERAALEKSTAELRQRALAEARERLVNACQEVREKSLAEKSSTEARIRVERAPVERATAEARGRASEKAMAERAAFEARERAERSASSASRIPHSAAYSGVEVESAQRCKARLERHQRTAERAAKALAEKNTLDLIAQREQAERNKLSETLDADVKRWSSGKEGNLRALLSTLQYILGPDSGWQPIPLTDVITAVGVKKAYRKATLCVHPDKLQQRRASIHQKYICDKVFDLLKEAWNKFNSEER